MVRAIVSGRKTMTRRVVKTQPDMSEYPDSKPTAITSHGYKWPVVEWASPSLAGRGSGVAPFQTRCPYGTVGDRLWVREAFSLVPCSAGVEKYPEGFDPKKSSASQPNAPGYGARYKATWDRSHSCGWKPSIHMPRWASRLTLEITGVRVERLQDITHHDALAEGVAYDVSKEDGAPLPRFKKLWHEINGSESWAANPWVWVVSFKRAELERTVVT